MRKIALILLTVISFSAFAQKTEVKAAEKAYKKGNLTEAKEMISKACKLKDQADNKTKSRILYTKARIYAKLGSKDLANYQTALNVIENLTKFEKETGKERYSDDGQELKSTIEQEVVKIVNNDLKKKNYISLEKSAKLAY